MNSNPPTGSDYPDCKHCQKACRRLSDTCMRCGLTLGEHVAIAPHPSTNQMCDDGISYTPPCKGFKMLYLSWRPGMPR